uniref:Uncharacterized protein n=1 Tax=Manihot esculenta TaxID=3983 RepID=A0A2C9UM37_MANES
MHTPISELCKFFRVEESRAAKVTNDGLTPLQTQMTKRFSRKWLDWHYNLINF